MAFFTRKYRAADKFTSTEVAFLINLADSGGGSFTTLTATGAVNGLNAAFTFIQEPTYVVSDGVMYSRLDSNGNTQWSWVALTKTVTMVVAPQTSIFGIA